MTTIDNIMALVLEYAEAYAEAYSDSGLKNRYTLADKAQSNLRTTLTEALAQQAEQGWQPIKTVQPHTEVIVAIQGGSVSTGSMIPNLGWVWNATDDEPEDACVIAWMPLPAAPKGGAV